MTSKRLNLLLVISLVVLGSATVGIGYGANTILSKQSNKLVAAKATTAALDSQQTQLSKNRQDITKYSELNNIAKTVVPQDKDQAEAVREIVNLAASSGILQLSSITFPASTLGVIVNGGPKTGGLTQVLPVAGITGVYDLQITIIQDSTHRVDYGQFISFLSKLEQNRRTAQVSGITIQPDPKQPSQIAFTLIIDEFIKPWVKT